MSDCTVQITGIGWCAPQDMGGTGQGVPRALPFGDGPLPELRRVDVLDAPDKSFGRMDALCRVWLAACAMALRDAGLYGKAARSTPTPAGAVMSTGYGCLATDVAYWGTVPPHGEMASPHLFAYTLPSIALGEAALRFGLTGPAMALQEPPGVAHGQGLAALATALDMIDWGEASLMLAGIAELGAPEAAVGLEGACGHAPRGALVLVLEKRLPPGYSALGYGSCAAPSGGEGAILYENAPVGDIQTLLSRLPFGRRA